MKKTWIMYLCLMGFPGMLANAQKDPMQSGARSVHEATNDKITLSLEERTRWEEKYGVNFGKNVDQQDMLSRLRIGMTYQPVKWLTFSGMGQDARAPFYGAVAPNSMRDSMDLHESYLTVGADTRPVEFSAGRRMLNYGETRVIGVPQWSNTSRTYDYGRLRFKNTHVTADALMVSPVIVVPDSFNAPELGNRYWGTYIVFPQIGHGIAADVYALRHSQNKIGGWSSAGTLGTNNYGARLYGTLPAKFTYSFEGIGQNGHSGIQDQRAYAWFAGIARPVQIAGLRVDTSAEYKGASGSHSWSAHNATFDQLSPANHDKFGDQDLFGWRNLKTFKTFEVVNFTKALSLSLMYTNENLFSASDALYNSSGSKISTSKKATAGTGVGQELDGWMTVKIGAHTFNAGVSHFFKGEFVQGTTPGINPRYFYISQQYNIK